MKTLREKMNNKGFTLAELLIVVAIIGVLAAISIPIFTQQLEKSREATDIANIRAAYAEVAANALTNPDQSGEITVKLKQTQTSWQTTSTTEIAGIPLASINNDSIKKGGSVVVKYAASTDGTGTITIHGTSVVANSFTSVS